MDLLRAEIERKKKGLDSVGVVAKNGTKHAYFKRSQLTRQHEEEQRRRRQAAAAAEQSKQPAQGQDGVDDAALLVDSSEEALPDIPVAELNRRLRALGEPVCLFGETTRDKRQRLRNVEMMAVDVVRERQRNDFQDAMNNVEEMVMNELAQGKDGSLLSSERRKPKYRWRDMQELGTKLGKDSPELDMTLIRRFWRYLLDLWGYDLDGREKTLRDSPEGRLASAIYRQTSEYLKPFFRMLKDKTISKDIVRGMREIVQCMVQREYINANDAYLRMAIGNAAWPIGVTNVGIHSRTGREKIFSQNIAHVLNDETQRKYIQAAKRLMTFCQKRFPNLPSKCLEYRGLQKGLYPVSYEAQLVSADYLPDDSTPPGSPAQ